MVAIFTGTGLGFEKGSASVLGSAGLLGSAAQGRGNEGVYVNATTGDLVLQRQDEVLVTKGPDVGISRTYNSLTPLADDNGDKWRQSTDRRVYGLSGTLNTAGSTIRRVSGDGTEIYYTWNQGWANGAGAYVTTSGGGACDVITYDSASSEWVWTDGDTQTQERYFDLGASSGLGGFIKSVTDLNGMTLTFAYEAGSNRLSTVTTNDGSFTRYDWVAGTNNIAQMVTGYSDWLGGPAKTLTRTRYGYDGSNRLTTVTVDLSPTDNSIADAKTYVITYGYDGSGRVNSVTQSDGSSIAVAYDGSGRVSTLTQTVSSGVTRTTTMAYGTGYSTVTDSSGQVTRLDYDASGNLTKITAPPAYSGAAQQVVQFGYGTYGDLTSTTDALGQTTTYGNFTADGQARTITDPLGNTITRTYGSIRRSDAAVFTYNDAANQAYSDDATYITNVLLSEAVTGVDATGTAVSETTRFAYDRWGNLRFKVTPEGRVTEFYWNTTGQLSANWDFAEAAYTTAGTISESTMAGWRNAMSDKSWITKTEYWYDFRGEKTKDITYTLNTAAGTASTADGYDEIDYLRDQAGQLLSTSVSGRNATTYVYDGLGRVTATTDGNGGTTTVVFTDTAGSITTVSTTASGYVTTETYNKAGDLFSLTDSGTNTTGGTTSYAYDTLGRVRVTTTAAGSKLYTVYDNAGRHVGEVNANGLLTEYRYDADNRLVGTIDYHAGVSSANMTALADPNNTLTVASLRPSLNPGDTSSWTIYDADGRVLETILGDGSATIFTYDAAGRLQKTTGYTNKIAVATVQGFVTTTPTGVITPTTSSSDAAARNFYDKDGRLVGTLDGEGYLVKNTYDGGGMLVATKAYANATLVADRASGSFNTLLSDVGTSALDRTTHFVYDSRKDLRFTIDALNQVTRYDYDIGNLQTVRTVYAASLTAATDYTYDDVKTKVATYLDGNTANRISFSVYDAANRLAYAIDASGEVTGYIYDNRGQVTRQVEYAVAYSATTLPTQATMDSWSASNIGNAANRITRTWYTARGEAAYVVDPEGFVSKNNYDGRGLRTSLTTWANAISVTDATTFAQVNTAVASAGATATHSWQYDSNNRMWREVDEMGIVTVYYYHGTTDLANFHYQAFGAADQSADLTNYDGAGHAVTSYRAYGASEQTTSTDAYDGKGNLTSTVDPRGKTTSYTYDLDGRVKTVTDAGGGVTSYEYNAFGEVWKATDPNGNVTYSWYDKFGRLTTQRDAGDYLTTTTYTVFGEIHNVNRWQTPVTGTASMTSEPTGSGADAITWFTYDKMGRVLTSVDALYHTESYGYDVLGNRTSVTNRLGGVTVYGYDRRGLMISEQIDGNVHNSNGNPLATYAITTYAYDARHNLVTRIVGTNTPAPVRTDYTYDADDRLIAETGDYVALTGKGGKDTFSIRPTTSYVYDARGNVTAKSDPNGALTLDWYDQLDRKTAEVDAAGVLTTYVYDADGNVTSTKVYGDPIAMASGGARPDLALDSSSPAAQISRVYDLVFGRMPTLAEIDSWVDRLANDPTLVNYVQPAAEGWNSGTMANDPYGAPLNRIEAIFAEWYGSGNTFFSGTNTDFINRVYQAAFHRAATSAEITTWNTNLGAGWTRAGVATLFSEHSDHRVASAGAIAAATRALFAAPPTPVNGSNYRETTFAYDNLNRLTDSTIAGVSTGWWDGTTYQTATDNITTHYDYDADGNVTKLTDPRGNITWNWYDKLDRKVGQLDGENYVTTWSFDAEGNVLQEKRYANLYTGTVGATVPDPGSQANDRITIYTYDLNGNRLTEKRTGVAAWNVDPATGALSAAGTDALITYTYNQIGKVLTKSIAGVTPAIYTYAYDVRGRLFSEAHQAYTDANGVSVTPKVWYYYDASSNVVRTLREGTTGTYSVADRVTRYTYGAGNRLLSQTDEEGFTHNYGYDAAGNLVRDSYSRVVSSDTSSSSSATTTVSEGILYVRDAVGRVVQQSVALDGASWTRLSTQYTEYNAWGQVSRSGTNTDGTAVLWQVTNQYDRAGRLTGTNSGDGVWKFFGYDKAGNQSAAITSAGVSFSSSTGLAGALALVGNANVDATYTNYDKRNMAVRVTEEGRDLSASVTGQTLVTNRIYDAFGGVWKEENAAGVWVVYTYNTMGLKTRTESPGVEITNEDGSTNWVKPSEDYYYDLGGRLVATRDANGTYASGGTEAAPKGKAANTGNLTTYALLAGTGYDGSQSLIATEFHADGGKKQTLYDRMGDARVIRDELYSAGAPNLHVTEQTFNRLGQLTQVKHNRATDVGDDSTRLIDSYVYDQFGQRIQHTNSEYGASYIDKTGYDALGRVISQTDMDGHVTATGYVWDGTLATSGLGTFGGWIETTTYANGRASISKTDLYDREVFEQDLGGNQFASTFDAAGRQLTRGNLYYTWYNTGLLATSAVVTGTVGVPDWNRKLTTYGYDKVGNRTSEQFVNDGSTTTSYGTGYFSYPVTSSYSLQYVNETATYDALGRLSSMIEAGSTYTPAANIAYKYDAAGNIRRTTSTHYTLADDGTPSASTVTDDYWFRYDAMNRLVVDKGVLFGLAGYSGTTIVRGMVYGYGASPLGEDYVYDLAGQRVAAIRTNSTPGVYYPVYYPGSYQEVRENYDYDGAGEVIDIRITQGTLVYDSIDPITGYPVAPAIPAAPATGGATRSAFTYDLMGRQTAQTDYDTNGVTSVYNRTATYAKNGQLLSDDAWTLKFEIGGGTNTYRTASTYSVTDASTGEYLLGATGTVTASNYKNGTYQNASSTINGYQWGDGAVQSTVSYTPDTSHPSTVYATTYHYDAQGTLTWVSINDGRPRTVSYRINGDGQVIRRDEADGNSTLGDPHEVWYRFAGHEMGYVGNNNPSTSQLTEDQSISDRRAAQYVGAFRNGAQYGSQYSDFAESATAINSYSQGSASGGYVVQHTGETLRSIAEQMWGDSSLWYQLAEANGLSADTTLIEGQRLSVPAGVTKNHNNAATFRPYDANDALGNVSPTTPKPPKKNKCGVFGQILLAVVAIAVTVIALPTGASPTIAEGALAGLAGGAASQTVGVVSGIQSKFDFKGLALSALGGAVGAGVGQVLGNGAMAGSRFVGDAVRGALGSAITQGIGVATGLQSKFSWAEVAAAGLGNAVGSGVAREMASDQGFLGIHAAQGSFASDFVSAGASVLANAATRSAINGSSFGDNILAGLPDAIGGVVGRTIGNATNEALARASGVTAAAFDDPSATAGQTTGSRAEIVVNQDAIERAMRLLPSNLPSTDLLSPEMNLDLAEGAGQISHIEAATWRDALTNAQAEMMHDYMLANAPLEAAGSLFSSNYMNDSYPSLPTPVSSYFDYNRRAAYLSDVAARAPADPVALRELADQQAALSNAKVVLAQASAYADSQINEVLRAGLAPFDVVSGGYNIAQGNGGLRDYLAVASVVPVGKTLGVAGAALGIEARSFTTFPALKRYLGSPGSGNQWHHIVEQTPGNLTAFGADAIHSTENMVSIPIDTHVGKGSISAYYSSIQLGTNGLTVRRWLSTQSFQAQRQYGLDTLKRFGQ